MRRITKIASLILVVALVCAAGVFATGCNIKSKEIISDDFSNEISTNIDKKILEYRGRNDTQDVNTYTFMAVSKDYEGLGNEIHKLFVATNQTLLNGKYPDQKIVVSIVAQNKYYETSSTVIASFMNYDRNAFTQGEPKIYNRIFVIHARGIDNQCAGFDREHVYDVNLESYWTSYASVTRVEVGQHIN